MTTKLINPITNLPWKKLIFSTMLAGSLAVLPALRATLPSTTSSNLTTVYANGGTVTTGQSGQVLTVTSTAPITVLNWGNFLDSTANGGVTTSGDTITFTLPGATSAILNEIAGTGTVNPMTLGSGGVITSNGKVSFIDANGIVIASGASINTAGFYASTLQENVAYFEQNGILQVFSSTPPVGTTTGTVSTGATATITTVGGGGDIRLAGNGVTLGGGTINGNVYLVDIGATTPAAVAANGTIASTTSGGVTVGGNLTISSNNGAVTLSGTTATSVAGNLSVTTGGGAANLNNSFTTTVTGNTTVNTVGTTNGTVTDPDGLTTNGLAITTGTGSGTGNGSVTLTGLTLGSNTVSVTGGNTSITDTADNTLTLGNSTISGTLTISAANNIATQNYGSTSATPATVTLTATSSNGISLTSGTTANGKISFNGSGAENFTTLSNSGTAGAVAITTTGNIALNTTSSVSISTLSLTSTGGTISQTTTAGDFISSATTLTVNAPTVTLNNTSNVLNSVVLQGGGTGGITLNDASALLTIANKTSTTGNVTITNVGAAAGNDNVSLGTLNSDSIAIGGNLNINLTSTTATAENILTGAGTVSVTGNTTVASSGASTTTALNAVTLGSNAATPAQAYTFTGPISVAITGTVGGNILLFGNSALVLGPVSSLVAGNLTAQSALTGSANAGISNPTGTIAILGTTTLAAGTSAAPSNIQIGGTTNPAALTGDVVVGIGTAEANNLSLTNSLPTLLDTSASTTPIKGQTVITQTGNGANNAVTIGGSITGVVPNLSIMDTGSSLTGNTAVTISTGGTTLSNFAIGGTGTVGVTTTNGAITLGAGINDLTSGLTTLTAKGASAAIADTASSPVNIFGAVTFNSDGPINISNNTSNSLGGVSLNATITSVTQNNNNITYTEGGGVSLLGVTVPGGLGGSYSGVVSITSVNSSVLETDTSAIILPSSSKLNLTASSSGAQVLLSSTNAAVNQIASPISVAASGNSVIWSNQPLQLSGIFVNVGTFAANTGAAGTAISEVAGTTVYSYGNDTFKTQGATITLTQSGNNFGALTVDTTNGGGAAGGANASIKEYGGDNYASVNTGTAGNFSATSEQSYILESGNTGIRVGGTTSLSAPLGIIANATGNLFNGGALKVTSTGNASITDGSVTTLLADGTNVTGTLTINNTNANGVIRDNGTTGNVTLGTGVFIVSTTGTGDISFTGGNNSISNTEIKSGTGTTTFDDNSSVAILPGTAVSGPAVVSSGGGITMSQAGPVTFLGTLSLNAASGNITFTDTSALFNAKVTAVDAGSTGDVNFSALSLATNFNGIAPAVTTSNNATYYQAPGP